MQRHFLPSLSLVISVLNEEKALPMLLSRLQPILQEYEVRGGKWEIIFIDDGSTDTTLAMIEELHQKDGRIKAVSFSRNFGQEAAIVAGLRHASGEVIIPLDADLQDPPELIPQMIAKWQEGYDVVMGQRRTRGGDTPAKRLTAKWFYVIYNRSTTLTVPENTASFRLMDRQVVEAVIRLPHPSRFLRGALTWAGFRSTTILFDREARSHGLSRWTALRLFTKALEGFFYYATRPLRAWSFVALAFGGWCILAGLLGFSTFDLLAMGLGVLLIQSAIGNEAHFYNLQDTQKRPEYVVAHLIGLDTAL